MKTKNYLILSVVAIVLFILASSTMLVAVGLLVRETVQWMAAICNTGIEGAIDLRDYFAFVRSVGAF